MKHPLSITAVLLGGWCLWGTCAAGQLPSVHGDPAKQISRWPAERVEMLDGRRYEGYIESEDDAWVHLIQIHRPAGRPMYLVIRPIERAAVAAVVRLEPQRRAELRQRIDQFVNRARIEAGRMEAVRLGLISREGVHYHRYRGKWFSLESTADEPTTRRIIVRIEQIFTAYRQILAPRTESQRPLRLVVLGSMDEYHAYLARLGVQIENPACFIQDDNLVVAGSELARFAAQLAKVKGQHDQLRAELRQLERQLSDRLAELSRQLQKEGIPGKEIAKLLTRERGKYDGQIKQKRRELDLCERTNARAFDAVTRQMFLRLYHEAFHAYLENYVYPHQDHHVPRWLNEGLATVSEAGLLESSTLRVDAPNRGALQRLKAELGAGQPLPLEKLLSAGQQAFVLGADAQRYYVHSWGLAYYLTFEKRLLGSPALDQYVRQSAKTSSPTERFERLVAMPLAEFEQQWREYILELR